MLFLRKLTRYDLSQPVDFRFHRPPPRRFSSRPIFRSCTFSAFLEPSSRDISTKEKENVNDVGANQCLDQIYVNVYEKIDRLHLLSRFFFPLVPSEKDLRTRVCRLSSKRRFLVTVSPFVSRVLCSLLAEKTSRAYVNTCLLPVCHEMTFRGRFFARSTRFKRHISSV